jgi:hypothetical protein
VVNNTGNGFDDDTFGTARRSTFQAVFDYLNTVLDHDGSADFIVNNSLSGGTGSLASAGTFFFGSTGFSNGLLYDHATSGIDPSGGIHDGFATFDFGYNWNSELDATSGSEFDLFTVALHEVSHAMGFASLIDSTTGNSEISGTNPGSYSGFDSFLELGDGTDLTTAGGNFVGDVADLTSDDVFFNGANAIAANGGAPVKIYAPNPFEPGSSVSHVDTATFPNAVMAHAIAPGVEKRGYTAIDRGILQDIGWNVNVVAVPEPSSLLALVFVFAPLVVSRRR